MITIDAAIEHSMERANKDCSECAKDHHQLAEWLIELKQLREEHNKYQWHDLRKNPNDLPKEDGKYLCESAGLLFPRTVFMDVYNFSNDLYAVNEFDFWKYEGTKKKGFFSYDSEYGYCENTLVIAWMPLPELVIED